MATKPKTKQTVEAVQNAAASATPREDSMTTAAALAGSGNADSGEPVSSDPGQLMQERMEALEKQLDAMRAEQEAALKALSQTAGESKAAKSEGAAPASDAADYVYVYANLPSGQIFALPDGGKVEIRGVPASLLRGPEGERLKGGKYGVTRVKKTEWEAVLRLYGDMALFREGLIFAANGEYDGAKEAENRRDMRHGLEPLDPTGRKVKTQPASRDEGDA